MKNEMEDKMKTEAREQYLRVGYYLIELARAVLTDTVPGPLPEGVTLKSLYQMAKRHNMDCIVYSGAKKIPGQDLGEFEQKWKQRSTQCAMQGVVQLAERAKLYKAFTEAGIKILPLKGCLIKEMYPRAEYRQMADMDILIEHKNTLAAKEIMESLGYEQEGVLGAHNHDEYIKKPWCCVEIHRDLLPKRIENAKKYKNIWSQAYEETPGSGIYRLSWDDFYIFLLEHFAKHYYAGGSGIRSVMDIYVFLENKKAELNPEYLEKKLKELNLWEFKETVEAIAEAWFVKGIPGVHTEAELLIISSGAYGTTEQHFRSEMEKREKKYGSKKLARLAYIVGLIFLKYESMCILYPILIRVPVLLPFCWIHRGIDRIFKKRDRISKQLGLLKKLDKS